MKHQLALSILVVALLSFGVGNIVGNAIMGTESPQLPQITETDNPLEVKPATGEPVPLTDFKLQGASSSQQQAEGGLQEPQTADDLQPNARTDLFSDDL